MNLRWIMLTVLLVVMATGFMIWLGSLPASPPVAGPGARPDANASPAPPLRFGLIPEREIFQQRQRYIALTDELSKRLERPIELVTGNTYGGILEDFEAERIDAAFLGSFIAVLAMDRFDARVLAKPEVENGVTTYRGVLLVRADSPIESVAGLAGRSVAMVRGTTAGALFPVAEFHERGMLAAADPPLFRWVGTHDAAIQELVAGRVDAAAVKDLRVLNYEASPDAVDLRWLATSPAVPNNALIVRAGMDRQLSDQLAQILLALHEDEPGRRALAQFGAVRFVPCASAEYDAVFELIERINDRWIDVGIAGEPPRREAGETSATADP
jgi:phosphonate transport system substrate-binding protein